MYYVYINKIAFNGEKKNNIIYYPVNVFNNCLGV